MIFLPKLHSTRIFINLHIKMTILTQNYSSALIELLCQFIHIYIYMLSKPKSSKIKQPILIKHYILSDLTNYSNTFINSFKSNPYTFYNIYHIYNFTFQFQSNYNLFKNKKTCKKI